MHSNNESRNSNHCGLYLINFIKNAIFLHRNSYQNEPLIAGILSNIYFPITICIYAIFGDD